jgi:hypothetical protein
VSCLRATRLALYRQAQIFAPQGSISTVRDWRTGLGAPAGGCVPWLSCCSARSSPRRRSSPMTHWCRCRCSIADAAAPRPGSYGRTPATTGHGKARCRPRSPCLQREPSRRGPAEPSLHSPGCSSSTPMLVQCVGREAEGGRGAVRLLLGTCPAQALRLNHATGSRIAERNQIEARSLIEDHRRSRASKGLRRCRWCAHSARGKGAGRLTLLRLDEGAKDRIDARLIAPSLSPKPSENTPV